LPTLYLRVYRFQHQKQRNGRSERTATGCICRVTCAGNILNYLDPASYCRPHVPYLAEGQETALEMTCVNRTRYLKINPPNNGNPPCFSNSFSSTMIRKVKRRENGKRRTVKTRRSYILALCLQTSVSVQQRKTYVPTTYNGKTLLNYAQQTCLDPIKSSSASFTQLNHRATPYQYYLKVNVKVK
jgi:hypothetical protein